MTSPAKGFALYITLKSFLEVGGRLPLRLLPDRMRLF